MADLNDAGPSYDRMGMVASVAAASEYETVFVKDVLSYAALRQKNWRKMAIRIRTRAKVQTMVAPVGRSILSER
jgi:hypothetical protein